MLKSIAIAFSALILTMPSVQAQSLPNLTPEQVQRIGRDLAPTNSQDFFKQGRERIEQEIRLLDRGVLSSDQTVLKVDPKLQDPENLQPFLPEVLGVAE